MLILEAFIQLNTKENIDVQQNIANNKVSLIFDGNQQNPIYFYASEGRYIKHDNDMFRGMYYIEEEKRGQAAKKIMWFLVFMKLS